MNSENANNGEFISLLESAQKLNRRSISKLLTMIESRDPNTSRQVRGLLERIKIKGSSRITAFTGSPGVGKSTFIEAYGCHLVNKGNKIAVLAIDPSSPLSGGSILGDKTRMAKLSHEENAFIRPSPSGISVGGVSRRCHESALLLRYLGFDHILVETVGVGQSEYVAANFADCLVYLEQPGSGDALQGMKKGLLELIDIAIVTKCEGERIQAGQKSRQSLTGAMDRKYELSAHERVFCVDSPNLGKTGDEIESAIDRVLSFSRTDNRRVQQWIEQELKEEFAELLKSTELDNKITKLIPTLSENPALTRSCSQDIFQEILGN